jgi:hypothetical protein
MTADARVQRRKDEVLADDAVLLEAIARLAPGSRDPFSDPEALAWAVEVGLLDAPHLRGNAAGCGKVVTRTIGGACLAVDRATCNPIPEAEHVACLVGRSVAASGMSQGFAPSTPQDKAKVLIGA